MKISRKINAAYPRLDEIIENFSEILKMHAFRDHKQKETQKRLPKNSVSLQDHQ